MSKSAIGKKAEKLFLDLPHGKVALFRFNDSYDLQSYASGCPADFVMVKNGVTMFIEVKASADKEKFPKQNLDNKNQKGASFLIDKCGGTYLYYLFSTYHNKWYILNYKDTINRKDWKWSNFQTLS